MVTEVAVTPCASRGEAEESISGTAAHLSRIAATGADDESSSEDEGGPDPADIAVVADDPEDDAQLIGPAEVSGDADGSGAGARPRRTHRHSIAEDVIGKRGSYGRFARRWFSRAGWTIDQKRNMGLSTSAVTAQDVDDVRGPEPPALTPHSSDVSGSVVFLPEEHDESHHRGAVSLLPKLLRTTHILFGSSRSFYFSYDIDITRSVVSASSNSSYPPASSPSTTDASSTPLYRQADPLYFWNRHVTQRFVDAGMDHLVLPLMQGFVGQRTFVVDASPPQPDDDDDAGAMSESVELSDMSPPRKSGGGTTPKDGATASATQRKDAGQETLRPSEARMLMTLVSRRSVQRAGLRYLRRGVDEDGYAANTVETEQILSRASDEDATAGNAASGGKTYSFLQLRGSIPLYFTQTPYSLKPAPVLQHSAAANRAALRRHFDRLRSRYGRLLLVNLVEKHGIEAPLGEAYAQNVQAMNEEGGGEHIRLEWFDFHAACRGMKFENVTLLLESVAATLEAFGSSVVDGDGKLIQRQTGVLRTNCMDCLDRTNVCQSFFAKHMLELQLGEEGFDMSAQADQETVWFNTLWADNGDAISKQYASTAAMKGDYTRTRKRDYRGTLTDMGLSLTRFYNG